MNHSEIISLVGWGYRDLGKIYILKSNKDDRVSVNGVEMPKF